jgi:glyoxylase-like metal-dependent hydrolase (beta-lactamase superfamily II)
VTVEGRLWIEGSGRSVELRTLRPAHTDGDLVLVVPDARVAFCGDLLFVGCHPYLADGDLDGLRAALGEIERLGAERLVPGHGPVGGAAEAATLTAYLDDIESIARRAPDQEPGVAIPDAYRAWGLRRFFAANVAFVSGPASDQRS